MKKILFGSVVVAAAIAASGCSSSNPPGGSRLPWGLDGSEAHESPPPPAQVRIDNFAFTPATLTVRPGTRVEWVNHDDVPHTVTGDSRSFASKALDTDDTFDFVFAKPGTYPYFCAVHPHMTGAVIVK